MSSLRSALEEGILPGGGVFFLSLREEMASWSFLNLVGDEIFASTILSQALLKPFQELFNNKNFTYFSILQKLEKENYPTRYDLIKKEFIMELNKGLLDSAKSTRSILWNSISIVSTLITSE